MLTSTTSWTCSNCGHVEQRRFMLHPFDESTLAAPAPKPVQAQTIVESLAFKGIRCRRSLAEFKETFIHYINANSRSMGEEFVTNFPFTTTTRKSTALLAGGACAKFLDRSIESGGSHLFDLDFFIFGEFHEHLKIIINYIYQLFGDATVVSLGGEIYNVYCSKLRCPIQLICVSSCENATTSISLYTHALWRQDVDADIDANLVLSSFDLTHLQVGYDGKDIIMTPAASAAWNSGITEVNSYKDVPVRIHAYRIASSLENGWHVRAPRSKCYIHNYSCGGEAYTSASAAYDYGDKAMMNRIFQSSLDELESGAKIWVFTQAEIDDMLKYNFEDEVRNEIKQDHAVCNHAEMFCDPVILRNVMRKSVEFDATMPLAEFEAFCRRILMPTCTVQKITGENTFKPCRPIHGHSIAKRDTLLHSNILV